MIWGKRPTPVRTLLAHGSRVVRREVGSLLGGEPGIDLVGQAATFREATHLIRLLKPDVVIIDSGMTGAADVESAKFRQVSDAFLVAISALPSEDGGSLAEQIGADVFVDKMRRFDDLIPAVLGRPSHRPGT
jgi:two-component system, NarL family, response regulator DevR